LPTYPAKLIDGEPAFDVPLSEILGQIKHGGALRVLSPVEYITDQQRKWYKGVCLPWLVKHDENQESTAWWDMEVKKRCDGLNLLKIEYRVWADGTITSRLTTKDVGKKKMTAFIEEILAKSVEMNWGIAPPDKELRKEQGRADLVAVQ